MSTLFAVDIYGGSDHYLDAPCAEDAVRDALAHDAEDDAVIAVEVTGESWTARVAGRPRKGRVVGFVIAS